MRHPHTDQLAPSSRAQPEAARAELTAIVGRAQAGDLDAHGELFRLYSHRIYGFVRTIIRDPNALEDVTQSVFVKMTRRLRWLREPVSFESWLFAMARSTALDHLRAKVRRPEAFIEDLERPDAADPSRPGLVTEIMEALNLALTQLSPTDQRLVNMVVEGHSYQTIADREKLTLGAVKARLTRVRPFLRAAVGLATGTRPPDVIVGRREVRPLRLTRMAA